MTKWRERLHHRQMQTVLYAFHTGDMSPAEQERIHRHLATCLDCRSTLEGLAATDHALKGARPEPDALDAPRMDAIFLRALHDSQSAPRRRPLRFAGAISLAAAGLGIAFWILHRPHAVSITKKSYTVASTSKESNEKPLANTLNRSANLSAVNEQMKRRHNTHLVAKKRARRYRSIALSPRARQMSTVGRQIVSALRWRTLGSLAYEDSRHDRTDSSFWEAGRLLANVDIQRLPTRHLMLIVTGQETARLKVIVTAKTSQDFGFARVSAFEPDSTGNGVLNQCMIRQDEENESTYTTQYRLLAGKPVSRLTLENNQPAEKSPSFEKGTKP